MLRFSTVYNACILTGIALIAFGAHLVAGAGVALIVTGTLVLALTVFAALLRLRSARGD